MLKTTCSSIMQPGSWPEWEEIVFGLFPKGHQRNEILCGGWTKACSKEAGKMQILSDLRWVITHLFLFVLICRVLLDHKDSKGIG